MLAGSVAVSFGLLLLALLAGAMNRAGHRALSLADDVTLLRGLMACGVAGLVADALPAAPTGAPFVSLTAVALALDAVDGQVARRTGTVTSLGARFDGEVDAFLILVLSLGAAPVVGWWVLALGLARYLFVAAGWLCPWLRRPLPERYWRKVVAATVGVALMTVAGVPLPRSLATLAAAGAGVLLAESFGRDVWWTWRRDARPASWPDPRPRPFARRLLIGLLLAVAWFALLAPGQTNRLGPAAFLRIPLEAVAFLGLAITLPPRPRRVAAVAAGVVLGLLALLRVLDLGMWSARLRPFDVLGDIPLLGSGLSFLRDSVGDWARLAGVLGAGVVVVVLVAGVPWALVRTSAWLARHRRATRWSAGGLAGVWSVCALAGWQAEAGLPLASAQLVPYAATKTDAVRAGLRDRPVFAAQIRTDAYAPGRPANLAVLQGKDVLIVFVESYGRVAIDGAASQEVPASLDALTTRLAATGYSARSAYLTSPTFGGSSWLAHATLQSGLEVDAQRRYDQLLTSQRTTLLSAFGVAGWRTVAVLPSTTGTWSEGRAFYRLNQVYGRSDLGYAGPTFGFSGMPDQFALKALARLELGRPRDRPVAAEVELTSSHGPWAPLPTLVAWDELGDGSVFRGIRDRAQTAADLWRDRSQVPSAYRASIRYALNSLGSFVEATADQDLVLLVVGDHQPATIISGPSGNHDVPVTLLTRDPDVLRAVAPWGWRSGLRPDESAPVWPMASLRDRFLAAFSTP